MQVMMNAICSLLLPLESAANRVLSPSLTRFIHKYSYEGIRNRRNEMFSAEKKRQKGNIGRVEKIEVQCLEVPETVTLSMNKAISTPYNCTQHLSEMLRERSALALINDNTQWDMHRPLEASCSLRFLHFKDNDPFLVNKAFWRSCSLILGAVASESFKEHIPVVLHSFPSPNVKSGSFVYDIHLDLDNWVPNKDELRILSGQMVDFCRKGYKMERLSVHVDFALEMFADNPYKSQQIPDIATNSESGNTVVLYQIGPHIDISKGPLIANTNFVARCSIVAVHQIECTDRPIYRFQGIALPQGLLLNHFAYSILENRAKILNQDKPIL